MPGARPVPVVTVASLARSALDLVLGAGCAGCGAPGAAACQHCRAALGRPRPARPDPCPPGLPPVVAAAEYAGATRALLLEHKEHGRLSLAAPLGAALASAAFGALAGALTGALTGAPGAPTGGLAGGGNGATALVPVPSRPGSARRRGHDPLLRISRVAAVDLRRRGIDVRVVPVLRLRRRVVDQAGLDSARRRANQHRAMSVASGAARLLDGGRLLLVDDVLTTGATLAEAARALHAAGHPPLAAAVVAATSRRAPPVSGAPVGD